MKVLNFDDDDDDDDERKRSKKLQFVSNDRSGPDDQNAYWIIKNGAILEGQTSVQSLALVFYPSGRPKTITITIGDSDSRKSL